MNRIVRALALTAFLAAGTTATTAAVASMAVAAPVATPNSVTGGGHR
ncbi:hypothetical protein GCM10009839_69670 [Catenulispora yoronensis]|uniref:Uncharacterized protein n=1 Tax=Catenulispora yoronensis TaxID=450799 RepID=A0ABN2V5Z2_9ACTN